MRHPAFAGEVTRQDLLDWFRGGRERSKRLFTIPAEDLYYRRPIALRNPIIFYEGHLPAFAVNTLLKLALGEPGIDEEFETLFARGIDPESEAAVRDPASMWPRREEVLAYAKTADERIERTLRDGAIEDEEVDALRGGEATLTILEHEEMHQETLLYMFHNLAPEQKRTIAAPNEHADFRAATHTVNELIAIPAGEATIGSDRIRSGFGWDNEHPSLRVPVPEFSIQRHNVTNGEFMEFVDAGGYRDASLWSEEGWRWIAMSGIQHPHFWMRLHGGWCWRGMFRLLPLNPASPVYVTQAEASAYARWRGMRIPTEAEYHRAAFGTPEGEERAFPWGDEPADHTRGNFDFTHWDPVPVGSYPDGASAWGVHDLMGNGWEWTSTPFAGLPGFLPMASYSAYSIDFFDDAHFVLKGASPATSRHLVRRSFRNWFRPTYPYVYATFRCVK